MRSELLEFLGSAIDDMGIDASFLETVWSKNLKIRQTRDWEEIPGAVSTKSYEEN